MLLGQPTKIQVEAGGIDLLLGGSTKVKGSPILMVLWWALVRNLRVLAESLVATYGRHSDDVANGRWPDCLFLKWAVEHEARGGNVIVSPRAECHVHLLTWISLIWTVEERGKENSRGNNFFLPHCCSGSDRNFHL